MAKKNKNNVFSAGTTDDEKKKRFQAGGVIAMLGFLAGGIFQILWMTVTPRYLGDVDMGLFTPFMFAFYGVATLIALGIPQTITTFVSKHYENELEESLKFAIDGVRLVFQITLSISALSVIAALIFGFTGIIDWLWCAMIVVFCTSIGCAAMFWSTNAILNGFQRLDLVTIGNFIYPIGIFITSTILIIVAQNIAGAESRWDVVGAVAGLGLGHAIAVVTSLIVIRRTGLVDIKKLFSFKSAYGLYGKILRFGGMAAVAFVGMTLVQNLPTVLVRAVGMKWLLFQSASSKVYETAAQSCEAAIGHFGTSLIYGMAGFLITGIAIAVIPAISEAEDRGRHDLMQHYYTSAIEQSMAILGAFISVYIVAIGPLIEILNGAGFSADVMHLLGILAIMVGSGVALLFVLIHIFTGLKKPATPSIILAIVIISTVLLVGGLCFTRNIHMPMVGFIITTWGANIACFIILQKQFKLKFPPHTFYEPVLAAVIPVTLTLLFMPDADPLPAKSWIVMLDIALVAGPYFVIISLFGKRRKKLTPDILESE